MPASTERARVRMGQRIGRGGMAEVFAAKLVGPAGFEKDVAVKRLLPRFASDPMFLERFLNEARLAAKLSHPNIVQIFELGHDGNDHYLVMEAVRGPSLRALLGRLGERRARLPVHLAAYVGGALCAGLAHAHEQHRVIHRDVSPHNVLISFDGAVKLIDFGIARARSDERLTHVGQVLGKRRYMSPEQTAGQPLDERSDIFAAGIILYEMLAGAHPFDGGDVPDPDVSGRIERGQRPRLHEVARDVDQALCDVVERALSTAREQRFATARDMGRALAGAGAQGGASALEDLLRRLFAAEAELPWPVEDVRSDGAEHTATGDVAAAQPPLHEITIASDIMEIPAVTDPSAKDPHAPIGVDEGPDVTQPDGRIESRRAFVFAGAGAAALAILGGGAALFARTPAAKTDVDAGTVRTGVIESDAGESAVVERDAGALVSDASDAGESAEDLEEPELPDGTPTPRRPKKKRGKLTVETRPWTNVRIDGKRAGTTPLAIELTVGKHRLTLDNGEAGIRREVDVTVTTEEPTVIRLDLRK